MMAIRKNSKGFTLIELAIVLVIIGIIIGAIMKGRDIIRDAQVKEYANAFAGKWVTMLDTYYSKTGQNLVDGTLNGGDAGGGDGFMDLRYYDSTRAGANRATTLAALRRAGVEPCNVVKSNLFNADPAVVCTDGKNVFQTKVDGELVSRQTTTVGLTNASIVVSGITQRKNILVISRVPLDVAVGIDKIYDGTDSGDGGSVINLGCVAAPTDGSEDTAVPSTATAPAPWNFTVPGTPSATVCTVGIVLEH